MRVPPGSQLVFDQVVSMPSGPGPVLKSDPKFNDWLGKANDLRLFVFADRTTGAGALTVLTETTTDEELAWSSRAAVVVGGAVLGPPTAFQGSDTIALVGLGCLGYRRLSVQMNGEVAGTVRIRIWAAGRNGYRRFHRLLLKERLQGTSLVYAPHEACAWLASVDLLTVAFFAEEVSGASPTLTMLLGESPNGRAWSDLPAGPYPISSGTFNFTFISNAFPWSGFFRLGVQLGGADNSATVRLWVTGRDVRSS